jgi:hypothetical protein
MAKPLTMSAMSAIFVFICQPPDSERLLVRLFDEIGEKVFETRENEGKGRRGEIPTPKAFGANRREMAADLKR